MALHVTDHAVDQFVRRIRPALSFVAARVELEALAALAIPMRRRSPHGHDLYRAGDAILVVKRDRYTHALIVVTVLDLARVPEPDTEPEEDPLA